MADRVSQVDLEALTQGTPNARVSQVDLEALTQGTPNARVSQVVMEVLTPSALLTNPFLAVTQIARETLRTDANPPLRVAQIARETLRTDPNPTLRVAQVAREVLLSIGNAPPPFAPCLEVWPPGTVAWVSSGIAKWDSDAPNPAPSGVVMGITLTTISPDFELVSATILAQQYTLRT